VPISPDRSAVIVVDLQNDFCSDRGVLAALGADIERNREVAQQVVPFVDRAREAGALVVWIRQVADESTASAARRARSAAMGRTATTVCARGTWGGELAEPLAPRPEDIVMEKYRYSAFVGTPLDMMLRSGGRDHVVVCGTAANVCVDSTARDAYMRDYHVTVPADLVGHSRADLAASALQTLGLYFGDVVESADLLEGWATSLTEPAA
jgi:ureidoacrylate peracid hydrolase